MNREIIDRRISQIEGAIARLKYNLTGQSSKKDFENNLNDLEDTVEDLKSHLERVLSPLRNG
jgi:archaellum component FlaC|tara:strand:+ start:471 stop:656 length:186 start_codon:yes stop_codon:yes gene_type:complete